MKKSQISVYLIFIIIIIFTFISLTMFNNYPFIEKNQYFETENLDTIYNYYYDCIDTNLDNLFYFLSSRGGYFYQPEYFIDLFTIDDNLLGVKIPLYLFNGKKYYLGEFDLKKEIKYGIKSIAYYCHYNINFTNFEYDLDIKNLETEILFSKNNIVSEINLPLEVIGINTKKKYSQFNFIHNTNFYSLYEIAVNITNEQYFLNNYFCFNCINEISNKNNININFIETYDNEKNILIYILNEDKNPELKFIFGHYFNNSII